MFETFRANPTLEMLLTFAGWRSGFSQADKDALAESLDTIRTAMVQPVGATSQAKQRGQSCVTDVEFDRAVMVTIASAMVMWLSGALEKVEVVSNG